MDNVVSMDAHRRARRGPRSVPRLRPAVSFAFDLASPATYLAAERVDRLFPAVGWIPVLGVGPGAQAAGREAEPSAAIIDSRTLRSSPESGERAGYDGAKRKKGSKLHLAVDTLGHMLALHVTPASAEDRAEVDRLAGAVQAATGDSVEVAGACPRGGGGRSGLHRRAGRRRRQTPWHPA